MLIQELRSCIYYVTQDEAPGERDITTMVGAVLRAGVGMILYRAKALSTREMIREATALARMTRAARTPLIVNDRVDVALAMGADGVHVGAQDMPVAHARRLMGPAAIIGATAPTPEDARIAQGDGATYVAVGPIYPVPAETHGPVIGLEGLERVRAATSLPICAIGGIAPERLIEVVGSGAELIGVMSAVHHQPDPERAAQDLVELAASIPHPHHRAP